MGPVTIRVQHDNMTPNTVRCRGTHIPQAFKKLINKNTENVADILQTEVSVFTLINSSSFSRKNKHLFIRVNHEVNWLKYVIISKCRKEQMKNRISIVEDWICQNSMNVIHNTCDARVFRICVHRMDAVTSVVTELNCCLQLALSKGILSFSHFEARVSQSSCSTTAWTSQWNSTQTD